MKKTLLLWILLGSFTAMAQTDTTKVEELNFDDFGNADDKVVKTYCTQKVVGLSPTKLISVGYEQQLEHTQTLNGTDTKQTVGGTRLMFNAPVISKSSLILNLGLNYWASNRDASSNPIYLRNLRTMGLNATVFKPLNNKNYLIVQASADHNANFDKITTFNGDALTYSVAALYGWKKNENQMFAIGLSRTYRGGESLIIPSVLYNRTYNANWGLEVTFPAKAHVRRNIKPSTYFMAGYEIEGNTFLLPEVGANNKDLYLRRGEVKPRIMFETKLKNFIWLSAQAGLRTNLRYEMFNDKNPVKDEAPINDLTLGSSMYFNVSLNLMSP
jgi:hypothetical protein